MNKIKQFLQLFLLNAGATGVIVEESTEEQGFATFGKEKAT